MPISKLSICNSALAKIGQERLASMDEPVKSAWLCNDRFDSLRDEVLEAHPWNFALKRATFAPLVGSPAFGYAHQFQKPADCLRIWAPDEEWVKYTVEGTKILTDDATFSCIYISRIEEPNEFSNAFAEALACRLAAEIAYAIAQSTTLQQTMMEAYERQLRTAKSNDAQEGTPDDDFIQGRWIRSRY